MAETHWLLPEINSLTQTKTIQSGGGQKKAKSKELSLGCDALESKVMYRHNYYLSKQGKDCKTHMKQEQVIDIKDEIQNAT